MKTKKKKAFTLLELLIVLAIITVLLLIAIPGARKFKESANAKADLMNRDTIKNAVSVYCLDNDWKDQSFIVDENCVLVTEGYLEKAIKNPVTQAYYTVKISNQSINVD